jgi:protocatechuate 3,4-dioxygenase beta subunit
MRPMSRHAIVLVVVGVVLFALVGAGGVAGAASGPCGSTGVLSGTGPFTCTYDVVGSDTFTVPAGVTSGTFSVVGAVGGNYFIDGDAAHPDPAGAITGNGGGGGGEAAGSLSVTPGEVLEVDVAGAGATGTAASRSGGMMNGPSGGSGALGGFGGSDGGVLGAAGDASGANGGTGFNGGNGGGGGGSSDVRVDPAGCAGLTCSLSDRVLVGSGGGGSGGTGGSGNAIGGAGGNGGDANGAPGSSTVAGGNAGVSGAGGTQAAGGAGGLNPGLHSPGANPNDPRYGGDGANGASGSGGAGGHGNLPCTGTQTPPCGGASSTTSGGGAGGGAGAGFFGGGGGSGGGGTFGGGGGAGGGGGGGSSFAAATVTNPVLTANANANTSSVTTNSNGTESYTTNGSVNSGNGQVTITWTPPAEPTEIAGTVTNGSGSPVANVCVYLYGSGPAGARTGDTGTCTDASGDYVMNVAAAGSYNVAFYDPSGTYLTQWYAGASSEAGATAVSVTAGAVTSGVNATMSGSTEIAGTVTNGSGTGLANICVYLYGSGAGGARTGDPGTCTDASGNYVMSVAAGGSYNVAFFDPSGGYNTQWYSGAGSEASATAVSVTAGAHTTGVNAAMTGPTPLTGTVTNASGAPLANVCVYLYAAGAAGARTGDTGTCTNASGQYVMSVASAGSYNVAFFDPSGTYETQWSGGASSEAAATPVTLTVGTPTPVVNATMAAVPIPPAT